MLPLVTIATVAGCGGGSGGGGEKPGLYKPEENEVVIYYKRDTDSNYEDWGLHLWNGEGCTSTDLEAMGIASTGTDWGSPYGYKDINETYGAYYVLKVDPDASDPHECMNFILHKGDEKALGSANSKLELRRLDGDKSIFTFHGSSELYYEAISERPVNIDGQKAHWLDAETIAWETIASADSVKLFHSQTNDIKMDENKQITGGTEVELTIAGDLSSELKERFRHLTSLQSATINATDAELHTILKSQIVMAAYNAEGKVIASTQVQKAGVLDAVFADESAGNAMGEELGAIVSGSDAEFKLWAPTAQSVKLFIYEDSDVTKQAKEVNMTENTTTGIWSASESGAVGKFYRYQVTVYHPTTGNIETVMVTDPYSLSLSQNSQLSHVVDLSDDDSLKPAGWDASNSPEFAKDENHILYESHLRDFSFSDASGTAAYNGKYKALTESSRESVSHLQELKDAGLTTLHILPAFDIATVDEDPAKQVNINDTVGKLCKVNENASLCGNKDENTVIADVLAGFDPTTEDAQALMDDLRMLDSFNWGYDPFHYTVPEGSYATDADGSTRVLEFREMVKATHDMGLKLVMDVVYNHTNASGTNTKSVLDKIVPGYYHRLNINTGDVEMSTCCDNTATENLMMGKLMVDSLKVWAEDYKVDGFRFDLMGHQPKDLMVKALEEVRAIDPDTLFYGEGWDFGEVSNNARFDQANQPNMAGTEIGTFSDRLRDAVRGGSPFDGGDTIRMNQGFGNAAYPHSDTDTEAVKDGMLHNQDLVRLGMAGNLADYLLVDRKGDVKKGSGVDYNGAPAGYTKHPSENISYVSKHDNQTLWDNNAYKTAAGISADKRARMQTVSMSTVMMGQGIPFIHMGSELLRSKSMQRDSYDSGDWFNKVEFDTSKGDNNWNVGLPNKGKDEANWPLIKKIIADSSIDVSISDIELTKAQFVELLKIRNSSELFRLDTAEEVMKRVDFHNVGKDQVQGLIVMSIDDGTDAGTDLDSANDAIVVVINSTADDQDFTITGTTGFELHDVQVNSEDSIVKNASFASETFSVPALTTAVFVQPQSGAQGAGLPVAEKELPTKPEGGAPYGDKTVYVRGVKTWDPVDGWAMTYNGDNTYSLTADVAVGDAEHGFKFAGSDWDAGPNIGCTNSTQASGSLSLGSEDNCKLDFEAASYTFSLDASDTDNPVISVIKN